MIVSKVNSAPSFTRAFTTRERKIYETEVQPEARAELGLDKTTATVFDFMIPYLKYDTGMGSSFSDDAQKMAGFFKSLCGINSLQLPPQGEVSDLVRSPYSSTSFSIGYHLIDLSKLTDKKYGTLLNERDLQNPYFTKQKDPQYADYKNVFGKNGHKAMLEVAYDMFTRLPASSPLKAEFEAFKKENEFWLERDALYEAAATVNKSNDSREWSERDQNVFATEEGDQERIAELRKVTNENGHNVVDFEEFIQFMADKQQKESKKAFNDQGIEIYGDCQIGFSQKDVWAHKSAFYDNYEFGCDIGDGKFSCWSPAINFDKLDGEAGELLYQKFNTMFKRYNGVRVDAAWQLMKPLLCTPLKDEEGKDVFDTNNNKLGNKIHNQPEVKNNGQFIIKDIILKAAKENGVAPDKVVLELLGGNSYDSLDAVKGLGTTLIHITKYGHGGWGRVKYYESTNPSNKYQNMNPGDYTIGPGTHDNDSIIAQSLDKEAVERRYKHLAEDLHLDPIKLKYGYRNFADAAFAELFTTKDQFITLPDIMGDDRRVNFPNMDTANWLYRVDDFERTYHAHLISGLGLNMPNALSIAIKAKNNGQETELTKKLDKFAQILREDGPLTQEDADKAEKEGELKNLYA